MPVKSRRTEKLDIRLTHEAKQTLNAAASARGRSMSDFVLESALTRAEEALMDRTRFNLTGAQWERFLAALDAPARTAPRLKRLLKEPSVFETKSRP